MSPYKPNATLFIKTYKILVCVKRKVVKDITPLGLEGKFIQYDGNVVNNNLTTLPSYLLPLDLTVNDRGNINIDNEINGVFIFHDVTQTRWKGLNKALGQTFSIFVENYKPPDQW